MQGIEKEIDELGRVVLPIEMRRTLGLQSKSKVILKMENNRILLSPKEKCCALCGKTGCVHADFRLCGACIERIRGAEL